MTQEQLNKICEEIFSIEPSLREKEDVVKKLILRLAEARPDAALDSAFVENLRREVLSHSIRPGLRQSIVNFIQNPYVFMPAAGLVVAVIVALGAFRSDTGPQILTETGSDNTIVALGSRAFGDLAITSDFGAGGKGGGSSPASGEATREAARDGMASAAMPAPLGMGMRGGSSSIGSGIASPQMVPPYFPTRLEFRYNGDDFTAAETGSVYRRIVAGAGSNISNLLSTITFNGLDIGNFANSKLQSFTLVQEEPFGYMISGSLADGSISINENWEYWDHPGKNCTNTECIERAQLRPEQIPSNDAIIGIANAFLESHGLSKDGYGDPVVNDEWQRAISIKGGVATSMEFYAPEAVSVVYPALIDGKTLYDEGGRPIGLTVNVNVRHKRVSGVWGIMSSRYEKSDYPLITDTESILQMAKNGGWYGQPMPVDSIAGEENVKVVYATLGTPSSGLVRIWSQKGTRGEELYIPALYFPVIDSGENPEIYQKAVVIPLVKELLEQAPVYRILEKN